MDPANNQDMSNALNKINAILKEDAAFYKYPKAADGLDFDTGEVVQG